MNYDPYNKEPSIRMLADLLMEGRRLHNQTVTSSDEVATWHRAVDKTLRLIHPDAPQQTGEEYDADARRDHRRRVAELFRRD